MTSSAPTAAKPLYCEHVGVSADPQLGAVDCAGCPLGSDQEAGEGNLEQPQHHEVEADDEQHGHGR